MENAKFYEKKGCCWVLDQKTLEKKCIRQFKEYLEYLKTKDINIHDYVSIENVLFN